jgi:hypothetical protein
LAINPHALGLEKTGAGAHERESLRYDWDRLSPLIRIILFAHQLVQLASELFVIDRSWVRIPSLAQLNTNKLRESARFTEKACVPFLRRSIDNDVLQIQRIALSAKNYEWLHFACKNEVRSRSLRGISKSLRERVAPFGCNSRFELPTKSTWRNISRRNSWTTKLVAKLFEGFGPLSTFSAKIEFAFALGLLPRHVHTDLRTIKKVRNLFAHARMNQTVRIF